MKKNLRLLLNAEPFGFGPAAAIAGFFPHLRPHFSHIAYLGEGHTLDLQSQLPYNAIHNSAKLTAEERDAILKDHDVLLSVTDFPTALRAKQLGLTVCMYDPLTWYWPEPFEAIQHADLYLAQNFIGVEERLEEWKEKLHGQTHLVSPIVPPKAPTKRDGHTLINLGGLQNPFWPIGSTAAYAHRLVEALLPLVENPVVVTSAAVAARLPENLGVKTATHEEMQTLLANAKCAIMTPGLGNIYDAAHYALPTLWLPPTNDSQGRQLNLVRHMGWAECWLDWVDLFPHMPIRYEDPQPKVLSAIATAVDTLLGISNAELTEHFQARLPHLKAPSKMAELINRYGRGGAHQVAKILINHLEKSHP